MKRRLFLKAGLSLGVTASRLQAASLSDEEIPPRIVVLSDIDSETNLDGLKTVMTALTKRQIPFACAIDPAVNSAAPLMPENPVAQFLRSFYLANHSLMELAPLIPDLELHRPYFQARLASLAIAQLSETLGIDVVGNRHQTISTISCLAAKNPQLITGLRAAGVRTVLALPRSDREALSNRQSDSGILHLIGGQKLNLTETDNTRFAQSIARDSGIFFVSARSFESFSNLSTVPSLAAKLDVLRRLDVTGQGGPVLPRDIQIRDGNSFARHIALHILDASSSDPALQVGVDLMKNLLAKRKINFSSSPPPAVKRPSLEGLAFWLPTTPLGKKRSGHKNQLEEPVWASFSANRDTGFPPNRRQSPGQEIILRVGLSPWQGMDVKGRYHQSVAFEVADTTAIAALPTALNPLSDSLVVLHPSALDSPANRTAILRALNGFRDDAVTVIVDLQTLIEATIPGRVAKVVEIQSWRNLRVT